MADSNTTRPVAGFNLDSVDTVTARLEQARGVLSVLTEARGQVTDAVIDAALWAAVELIEQAQAAVGGLRKTQEAAA